MRNFAGKMSILILSMSTLYYGQVKKEWFVYAGYSQSAQTIIDYSNPQLSKQILSYFRFSGLRQNVHFFYLGAEQHLTFSDSTKFSLIWGFYLSQKGYKFYSDFISSGNEYLTKEKYALYYLSFPLYIQRNLFKSIYINYGIVPSIMFYNKYDFNYDVKIISSNSHLNERHLHLTDHYGEQEINFVDLSIRIGLSYPINTHLWVDLNYDKGCVNVNRNKLGALGYQNIWLLGVRYKLK